MELDIKDYLHYYIGCRIKVMEGTYLDLTPERFAAYCNAKHLNDYKLCLRPLSDMKEEEATDVYTIERDRVLHPPTDEHDVRRGDGCWKIVRLDHIDTTLLITDKGSIHKATEDGKKQMIEIIRNFPEIFHYLLSNGFDLFSLIENNLAIDKTKMK